MQRLLLVPLVMLPLLAFGAPAHAASYCDSYGHCTGPSANDWNRWLWANDPGYNGFIYQPGYYVPRPYYNYSPYGYPIDPYYDDSWRYPNHRDRSYWGDDDRHWHHHSW